MSPIPTSDLAADLRELTALPGPVGSEGPVAEWLAQRLEGMSLAPAIDSMGNLCLPCDGERPRVLVTAHMDQVAWIVSRVDRGGALCLPLGGPDASVGEHVPVRVLGDAHAPIDAQLEARDGGSAAITAPSLEGVEVGDRVVFATELDVRDDGSVQGQSLDDRVGCLMALHAARELAGQRPEVAFAWTVREEAEQSGVVRVARDMQPDAMVGLDITYAVGSDEGAQSPLEPGGGPAITLLDGGMVGNWPLVRSFDAAATSLGIEWQREVVSGGVSEAGRVQRMLGIPSIALLVPIHNPHSRREVAFLSDIAAAIDLLVVAVRELAATSAAAL
ncbi:MAG: hypothetical protein ACJ768_22975 [Gaiellaceae bacterium]